MTLVDILPSPSSFLDTVFKGLSDLAVDVDSFDLDHFCYRVETTERYLELKQDLISIGTQLSEKEIGGRPILVVQPDQPYSWKGRNIKLLELPAPKTSSPYEEGWEHIELVIDTDILQFKQTYDHLDWDIKGLSKDVNRDIRLQLGYKSVKFHEYPLDYVIKHLD